MKSTSNRFLSARKKHREKLHIGFTQTYILSIGLIIILGIYYVWSLNANANSGYALSEINRQHDELKDRTNILQTRIGDVSSVRRMQEFEDAMDPVSDRVTKYIYLEDLEIVLNQNNATST